MCCRRTTSTIVYLRKRALAILDLWPLRVTLLCVAGVVVVALILYKTQSEHVEAMNLFWTTLERPAGDDATGWSPPPIEPPIDFRYLDGPRISALYSELESDFPEKQRTLATERSGGVTVGVGGSKAEASGKVTETSSYQQDLTPDRKCVQLLNILLSRRKVPYYTTAADWQEHELDRIKETQKVTVTKLADLFDAEVKALPGMGAAGRKLTESA